MAILTAVMGVTLCELSKQAGFELEAAQAHQTHAKRYVEMVEGSTVVSQIPIATMGTS